MSTRSAESREHSPDQDDSPEKRASKKRKVLSCYACRNRKMKCDRVYPVCGRCQKTGRADQCTYDPRLIEDLQHVNGDGHTAGGPGAPHLQDSHYGLPASTSVPSDALSWTVRAQERKLAALERKLASIEQANATSPATLEPYHGDDFDAPAPEPAFREEMMFRGKGFKTRFYGSTCPMSLLAQFRELQTFTKEALASDSAMARVRNDFRAFRDRRKALIKDKKARTVGTDEEIFALVPEKAKVDAAVECYFRCCETTYRILHEPVFMKEYQSFWSEGARANAPASFAAILILIVAAIGSLFNDKEAMFIGDISVEREAATSSVDTCDFWLQRQSRKHLSLHFFQVQCLSVLAKRINCIKMKQDWVSSGDVMRMAVAAGLHRDPSLLVLGKISEFDKEMRRRLWATIAELELQSSVDAGHQSALCGLHYDTQPPANIPDDAFSPESDQRPVGRPLDYFTRTSYLSCSSRSLPLRVQLVQLLNNPAMNIQYNDVLHYTDKIASMLKAHPDWQDAYAPIPTALLDLQLRQFLIMLHRPYAKLSPQNSRYSYSFTTTVDAASTILSLSDNLLNKGLFTISYCRNDVLRVVITLAQLVYYNSTLPETTDAAPTARPSDVSSLDRSAQQVIDGGTGIASTKPPGPSPTLKIPHLPKNNFMMTTLCTAAIELMDLGRTLYEHKIMHLGTGYMEYWLMSAAIGLMPSTPTTPATTTKSINTAADDIRSRGRKAIERMTSMCFRVLAMQKDPANGFAQALRSTVIAGSPSDQQSNIQSGASSGHIPNYDTPMTVASNNFPMQPFIPGASGMVASLDSGANPGIGVPGTWDALQDMQVDLGGWNFPDFWGFDIGGDF